MKEHMYRYYIGLLGYFKASKLGLIYRCVYVTVFTLEVYVCICYLIKFIWFNKLSINAYSDMNFLLGLFKFLDKMSCCNISENPASFGSMMAMQGICTAIIIFLYSRYGQGASGIPAERLIEYEIGNKMIYVYRLTSLVLPIISFAFLYIKWYGAAIVCAFFLYAIIAAYVFLAAKLMQHEQTLGIVKKMLGSEILGKEKVYDLYITEEMFYGYYKYEYNEEAKKERISLETKRKVYQSLKSEMVYQIFDGNDQYRLNETIKAVYEQLARLATNNPTINFIYMYDLVYQMFKVSTGFPRESALIIVDQIITELNNQNKMCEKTEEYEALYFAIICVILSSDGQSEKDYLWYDFFLEQEQNNYKLAINLFVLSLGFIELLRRKGKSYLFFIDMVKTNKIKFKDIAYTKKGFQKYSFVLSILGFGTETYIRQCFGDIEEDLENLKDSNYLPKTLIGAI